MSSGGGTPRLPRERASTASQAAGMSGSHMILGRGARETPSSPPLQFRVVLPAPSICSEPSTDLSSPLTPRSHPRSSQDTLVSSSAEDGTAVEETGVTESRLVWISHLRAGSETRIWWPAATRNVDYDNRLITVRPLCTTLDVGSRDIFEYPYTGYAAADASGEAAMWNAGRRRSVSGPQSNEEFEKAWERIRALKSTPLAALIEAVASFDKNGLVPASISTRAASPMPTPPSSISPAGTTTSVKRSLSKKLFSPPSTNEDDVDELMTTPKRSRSTQRSSATAAQPQGSHVSDDDDDLPSMSQALRCSPIKTAPATADTNKSVGGAHTSSRLLYDESPGKRTTELPRKRGRIDGTAEQEENNTKRTEKIPKARVPKGKKKSTRVEAESDAEDHVNNPAPDPPLRASIGWEDLSESDDDLQEIVGNIVAPGTLILAKYKNVFFPAKVLSHERVDGKRRYKIEYGDGDVTDVSRTMFHTEKEPKFISCMLSSVADETLDEDLVSLDSEELQLVLRRIKPEIDIVVKNTPPNTIKSLLPKDFQQIGCVEESTMDLIVSQLVNMFPKRSYDFVSQIILPEVVARILVSLKKYATVTEAKQHLYPKEWHFSKQVLARRQALCRRAEYLDVQKMEK